MEEVEADTQEQAEEIVNDMLIGCLIRTGNFSLETEELEPYVLDGKVDPELEPKPIGMQCSISWDEEEGRQDVYISFLKGKDHDKDLLEQTGLDEHGIADDLIFYYMETEEVDALQRAIGDDREQFSVGAGWAIDLSESWAMAYDI
jgi:hypothetical protein